VNENTLFTRLTEEGEAAPQTCLGMHVELVGNAPLGHPLEAFVIAKTLDVGDVNYRLLSTPDLNTIEALGMLRLAILLVEKGIIMHSEAEDEDEEDGEAC
jgi:hypothetical protein